MHPYPLLFDPILKPKVWGGRALEALGKPLPPDEPIGESWELADLPLSIDQGRSVVANGTNAGRTLRELLDEDAETIVGDARLSDDGGFPLLIKYLDARENLSVQVHPTAEYVEKNPDAHLKSEAWYVVSAEPGAVIYKGVTPGLTPEEFARHIEHGTVVDDLVAVPVEPGDCHYLPSGTCHALGGGIVVAEIQTPSDTTFRVYDWGRTDRELHVDQALQCIDFEGQVSSAPDTPIPIETNGVRIEQLVKTEYFIIERIETQEPSRFEAVTSGLPEVWMMLRGAGLLQCHSTPDVHLRPGVTTLLPAGSSETVARLEPTSELLRVTLPSPLEGLIA
jgi:mannose-6-phosphate isomerase